MLTLTLISAVLNVMYDEGLAQNFRRDSLLPNLLPVEFDSNGSCLWKVKLEDRDTAAAKDQGYDVQSSDYSTDLRKQATLTWAHYEAYAAITGTAQRIAAANGGGGGDGELNAELRDAVEELTAKISAHTYSGSSSASPVEIEGLARAVDSTGTYAGLAQGTYTEWASGEQTLATASLSIANIRTKLLRPFKDNTGRYPDIVVCPGDVFDSIVALFDTKTTIMVETINTPERGQVEIGKLGFRGIMIDGVPFVEDRHCTASTLYALDLRELSYRQTPPIWSTMDPGQLQGAIKELTGQIVEISEIAAAQKKAAKRLSVQVNALAKTGDSTKLQVVIDLQLKLRKRKAAAKLTLT